MKKLKTHNPKELVEFITNALAAGNTAENATGTRSNSQTETQIAFRMQFANVMTVSSLLSYPIQKAGREIKPKTLSDHNYFAQLNLKRGIKVYLTRDELMFKSCVVAPYALTTGSLEDIALTTRDNALVTSLKIPADMVITDTTTVGEVSKALLAANPGILKNKDQFLAIHLIQRIATVAEQPVPRASLQHHAFEIQVDSKRVFRLQMPEKYFSVTPDGYVATESDLEEGGMLFVYSRKVKGALRVSSQSIKLTPGNQTYARYSSEAKRQEALASFGTAEKSIYEYKMGQSLSDDDPDEPVDPDDPTFAVTAVRKNGVLVPKASGVLAVSSGDVLKIEGRNLNGVEIKVRLLSDPTGDPETAALTTLGSVTSGTDAMTVNITMSEAELYYLLRADTQQIVYGFE